jgi:hypothetical protein
MDYLYVRYVGSCDCQCDNRQANHVGLGTSRQPVPAFLKSSLHDRSCSLNRQLRYLYPKLFRLLPIVLLAS